MQLLYKNKNLLFMDFQDFLSRKQHIPENHLPHHFRRENRFHYRISHSPAISANL
jgi:hypothetical protein